jgi:hypothetical protein
VKKTYKDETEMFEDYNFKLAIIDALLEKQPSFMDELESMKKKHCDKFELYKDISPIEEMAQYFAELKLERNDLDKITEICFDGGNEIYFYICPDWDGENDYFEIKSVDGYKNLKNLISITHISMIEEAILQPMKIDGIEVF